MLAIGGVGYNTHARDGLAFRKSIQDYLIAKSQLKQFDLTPSLSSNKARIMLIGDSHAMALQPGLIPFFGDQIALHWGPECIPFYGVDRFDSRFKPGSCINAMNAAFDKAENDPNIRAVILTGMGPVYLSGETFHDPDISRVTGQRVILKNRPDITDPWEVYRLGMIETLTRLNNLNKVVIFVIDVPELGFDPHSCLENRRSFFSSNQKKKICAIPRIEYDQRTEKYKQLVNQVSAQFPNLILVDPTELFCDAKWCWAAKDGKILYHDIDHISNLGSYLVGHLISSKIQSKPELAQKLLPISIINTPILFSRGTKEPTPFVLSSEWAFPEEWGTWSTGRFARLTLPLPFVSGSLNNATDKTINSSPPSELVLDVRALVNTQHPILHLKIIINDHQTQDLNLTQGDNNLITIPITKSIKEAGFVQIDFEFLNPVKPKDIGMGSDDRLLSIGLKSAIFH